MPIVVAALAILDCGLIDPTTGAQPALATTGSGFGRQIRMASSLAAVSSPGAGECPSKRGFGSAGV
ncbi:hypothetical protein HEP86_03130 [Streptomyces sp. RPA4-5]|uniref:hypothetical protein n=1 Tax=Streptomyces sp. RPA4-5 TaxID=2721245 RepID=UPI00143E84BB|nr:hypothetical protein [Streptomyces sp. RPA4-5]QIY53652.1 hypothetical protein HEP86_03130 [Streptomyces sp. RPA4-5]